MTNIKKALPGQAYATGMGQLVTTVCADMLVRPLWYELGVFCVVGIWYELV